MSLSAPETAVQEATVAGVAHTDLGWVAAGWQIHAGRGEPFSDLIVWTSKDGQNWTRNGRDAGTFEQYAYAVGIGIGIGIGVGVAFGAQGHHHGCLLYTSRCV